MPSVSPRIRAEPVAASRSASGPVTFFPSRTMLASQYVRRYRFSIRHIVESATSSTPNPGTLHTAIPATPPITGNTRHIYNGEIMKWGLGVQNVSSGVLHSSYNYFIFLFSFIFFTFKGWMCNMALIVDQCLQQCTETFVQSDTLHNLVLPGHICTKWESLWLLFQRSASTM